MSARARSAGLLMLVLDPGAAFAQSPPVEVVVQGPRRKRDVVEEGVDAVQGRQIAGTLGDPVKAVENLPGLARPSLGSGELIVWGSAPSDTRTYVDGVEIPQLFHGSALRSTINGGLVRDAALTPGAYGAEYGRGMGGVVRVETADLPVNGAHGYVAADVLDSSAMLSAAPREGVRLAVAGRYGWLDRVLSTVRSRDVGDFLTIPRYQDVQAKAQFALRTGESLDVAALASRDALTRSIPDADPARARAADTVAGFERLYVRYRRVSDAATIEVVPWWGHDTSLKDDRFGANPARLDERTWRWGIRASHRSFVAAGIRMTAGIDVASASSEIFRQGSLTVPAREGDVSVFGQPPGDDTNTDSWNASVTDVAPYLAFDCRWGPLTIAPGLRVDGYLLDTGRQTPRVGQTPAIGSLQLQVEVEPRIAARLRVAPSLVILSAVGVYSQTAAASDTSAVFGTPSLGVQHGYHATLGETIALTTTLGLETVGYYKSLQDLPTRDPSPAPKLAHVLVEEGVGRVYGLQMTLRQQPWNGFFGWVAYTISRSERRDNAGAAVRLFDDDQSHVLTAVVSKQLGLWSFGLRFRHARGSPRTPVVSSFYDAKNGGFQPVFGPRNSIRLPDFWQLDLRFDRRFELGDTARLVVYVEALNVTNHMNGEEYTYSADYKRRGLVTGFPAVGSIGLRMEF